jgi:hypothetical protein
VVCFVLCVVCVLCVGGGGGRGYCVYAVLSVCLFMLYVFRPCRDATWRDVLTWIMAPEVKDTYTIFRVGVEWLPHSPVSAPTRPLPDPCRSTDAPKLEFQLSRVLRKSYNSESLGPLRIREPRAVVVSPGTAQRAKYRVYTSRKNLLRIDISGAHFRARDSVSIVVAGSS